MSNARTPRLSFAPALLAIIVAASAGCTKEAPPGFKDPFAAMVLVKGGCFQMGDVFGDGEPDEKPVHEVCLDDFHLGAHEVTQGEWKALMGNNPSGFKNCGDLCPVDNVSWIDTQKFIEKLNRTTGRNFRLPTEAEWEYAAREGGKKLKWAGTNNESELGDYAWYSENAAGTTHPVGTRKPNALDIYDMNGNVIEWLADPWDKRFYQRSPRENPHGPEQGVIFAARGGSWRSDGPFMRVLNRYSDAAAFRSDNHGIRLAHGATK